MDLGQSELKLNVINFCLDQFGVKEISVFESLTNLATYVSKKLFLHITVLHDVHAVCSVARHFFFKSHHTAILFELQLPLICFLL